MLKVAVVGLLAVAPLAMVTSPGAAATGPTHTLQVAGTGVGLYPAYDPGTRRYAATTTEATFPSDSTDNTTNLGASVTVQATTSDPDGQVLVDGVPMSGGETTLSGVDAGTEISVVYVDAGGREADSVVVLPADFPTLTATIHGPGITPGYVALTLGQWQNNGWPNFEAVVDTNGVPVWTRSSHSGGLDLKLQPNGHYSESRGPAAEGQVLGSTQVVELDAQFQPMASFHTEGTLTSTDGHDSILEPDGSRVLLAYEPNPTTGQTDSVIQEVDPQGQVTFQWDSSALAGETVIAAPAKDYAHINSVQIINGGEDFLASFRNLSAVIEIARLPHDGYQPGDIVWKLGGRDSSFSFVDDPDNGPCGQHYATQLPDGDIMVFDDGSINGFGALCVDPTDPTGPVVERPHSRLAVWHLDHQAGTATLVRSYAPSGWFAWFMGSAQPLPQTGNVLIGWASATQALATELAPDNTPVWQLSAAPSSNGHTYFSYRSIKFDVPDATDPVVSVSSPADGATYALGAAATADFSCTDAGGSTLQTCGDQLPGTPLDTSVAGDHTFTVTATDGAGNTTTVTRHYTVEQPPAVYRPDASVRRPDGTWLGTRVYGTAVGQTTTRRVAAGATTSVPFRLTNRGNRDDRCWVAGSRGSASMRVSYWFGTHDVTDAVVAGVWRTPHLAAHARTVLRARVHASAAARPGSVRTVAVTCRSIHLSSARDAAGVRVTVR